MLKGLSKRPIYKELVNELGEDPVKKYPDRKASQIENRNYMSQLASGFQEVFEQNDKLMKEKTKELLLQEMASGGAVSHQSLKSLSSLGMSNLMAGAGARPSFLPSQQPQQYQIGSPRSVHSAVSADSETTKQKKEELNKLFPPDINPYHLLDRMPRETTTNNNIHSNSITSSKHNSSSQNDK